MKQNDGQVGMTLGSIGTCEIDQIYTWCPDMFTDLTHPEASYFINNVTSGMWIVIDRTMALSETSRTEHFGHSLSETSAKVRPNRTCYSETKYETANQIIGFQFYL